MIDSATIIKDFTAADSCAWQEYVLNHPCGTVFHHLAWSQGVEWAYGHRPLHLVAWRGGRIAGVLPLFLVKSLLAGRVLVSVPYATYGGIVADDSEAAAGLLEAAKELCARYAGRYLELRHREQSGLDLQEIGHYDTFRRELPAQAGEVLGTLPRKARASARKGVELLGPDAVEMGGHLLDTIYDLYSIALRRLGSPNYRREFFHRLAEAYGSDCVCMVVRDAGQPVAGVVSFIFRDEIVPYFSGSVQAGMAKCANNVMYLRLMEYAVERGLRWFDFNRSRRDNEGPHSFKRNHGFEPTPLHYQVFLSEGQALPNLTPSNRKYALAGRVWRQLPLWLTRTAGGSVSQWIP